MDAPQLRDIHLPAAPGFWPPAPGWWLLAALVLTLCLVTMWKLRQRHIRRRRHRAVLAELQRVRADWLRHGDRQRFAAEVSNFLRRLARASAPDSVALAGNDWIAALQAHGTTFDAATQHALLQAPYRPGVAFDADALYAQVERHAQHALRTELRDV